MTKALAISNLAKQYGNDFQALKGIDLSVEEGDFFALLGPNGAGKSTAIGIISSLVTKSSGSVSIFGVDIDQNFALAKSYIGVVPQEFNFNQFEQAINILVAQAGYYGIPKKIALIRAEKSLKALGLWEKRHTPARMLSGGMKRRLMIARALIHEPKLLILDEPTAGVDIEMRRTLWEFLQQVNAQGTTIILTTHYLEEAESLCRNIAIIDHGVIVQNSSMKDLLKQLKEEVFILDMENEVPSCLDLPDFKWKQIDSHCLSVSVSQGQSINTLFSTLTGQGVNVSSMRNKTNRLEELFVKLVERGQS